MDETVLQLTPFGGNECGGSFFPFCCGDFDKLIKYNWKYNES